MKRQRYLPFLLFLISLMMLIPACTPADAPQDAQEPPTEVQADNPTPDTIEPVEEVEEEEQPTELELLIEVDFMTEDGRTLQGTYYPAGIDDAPLVILMHWAPGDQSDMAVLAAWLQNRGLLDTLTVDAAGKPWLDSSWFPAISAERTYAVFTFTFYGCQGGCKSFDREKWLLDAQAAVMYAVTLEGVDTSRVAVIGASIGADGAADGCLYLHEMDAGDCLGSLSLSPGNYLTLPYAEVVAKLVAMDPMVPATCLYAVNDVESAVACEAVEPVQGYEMVQYQGADHGLMLVQPGLDHETLVILLDFLTVTID